MPQLNKGDTFADGQQVTGVRLNNLIDGATLLSGAITDQTNITPNTVASSDSILLYDLSATALREANVSDVLGSNLAITTSAIIGGPGVDLVVTPAAGQKVDVAGAFEANSINATGNITVGGTLGGTSGIKVATGTTAERPASPVAGQLRFNTTSNTLEVYSGTGWINGNTSGSADFDGLVNTQNFTIRNKSFLFGIYDTNTYQVEVKSPVTVNTTPMGLPGSNTTSYGYYETTIAHTKPADEIWAVGLSFQMLWLNVLVHPAMSVNYTVQCQLEDGTLIGTVETKTHTPATVPAEGGGVEFVEPSIMNISINTTIPLGTVFTSKKLRFFFRYVANLWYTPDSNLKTMLADHPNDTYWSNVNKTLTLTKSLLSKYP